MLQPSQDLINALLLISILIINSKVEIPKHRGIYALLHSLQTFFETAEVRLRVIRFLNCRV